MTPQSPPSQADDPDEQWDRRIVQTFWALQNLCSVPIYRQQVDGKPIRCPKGAKPCSPPLSTQRSISNIKPLCFFLEMDTTINKNHAVSMQNQQVRYLPYRLHLYQTFTHPKNPIIRLCCASKSPNSNLFGKKTDVTIFPSSIAFIWFSKAEGGYSWFPLISRGLMTGYVAITALMDPSWLGKSRMNC